VTTIFLFRLDFEDFAMDGGSAPKLPCDRDSMQVCLQSSQFKEGHSTFFIQLVSNPLTLMHTHSAKSLIRHFLYVFKSASGKVVNTFPYNLVQVKLCIMNIVSKMSHQHQLTVKEKLSSWLYEKKQIPFVSFLKTSDFIETLK
jgi:hypothetical protein